MPVIDILIAIAVIISIVVGFIRGFVKEAMSLAKWIFATWIAATFAQKLAPMLPAARKPATGAIPSD